MTTSAHPIRLLSRTEADVSTLFYSFFLVHVVEGDYQVVSKFPANRESLSTLESGLQVYLSTALNKIADSEAFGTNSITITDGSKFYAYWKGHKDIIFIGFSQYYYASFARRVFDLLQLEVTEEIPKILSCLCELPVYPNCGAKFDIEMRGGVASLTFSSIEQASDEDMSVIALSFFTPKMLVMAWEAIVLERNVLVVGSNDSIVSCCCEFLRRMTLPLNYCNIYIPQLLPELIDVISESPCPYIVGADSELLKASNFVPREAVIIDLNLRNAIPVFSNNEISAPTALTQRLIGELNYVMSSTLGNWFNRGSNNCVSPFEASFVSGQADAVIQVFIRTNLALLGSRACTVRAFFRKPIATVGSNSVELEVPPIRRRNAGGSMGFERRFGVCYGFMQLLRERADIDEIQHFIPCWVEMDGLSCCIYEHADELPLISLYTKDIESVSPLPIEPEGHVFEVVTRLKRTTYRFTTTDSESRRLWMAFMEEILQSAIQPMTPGAMGTVTTTSSNTTSATPPVTEMSSLDVGPQFKRFSDPNGTHIFEFTEEDQENTLTQFRGLFMKTQLVSFLSTIIESGEFEPLMRQLNTDIKAVEKFCFDDPMHALLWNGGTISSTLEAIANGQNASDFLTSSIAALKAKQAQIAASGVSSRSNRSTNDVDAARRLEKSPSAKSTDSKGSSKPKSGGLLGFFRNKPDAKEIVETDPDKEQERARLQIEREQEATKMRERKQYLQLIASSYRRCDSELSKKLVEDRMQVVSNLIHQYAEAKRTMANVESVVYNLNNLLNIATTSRKPGKDEIPATLAIHMWNALVGRGKQFNDYEDDVPIGISSVNLSGSSDEESKKELIALQRNILSTVKSQFDSAKKFSTRSHMVPWLAGVLGYMYDELRDYDKALEHYAGHGNLTSQKRLMRILARKFTALVGVSAVNGKGSHSNLTVTTTNNNTAQSEMEVTPVAIVNFLAWAQRIGAVVGFQAYRLVTEVLHRNVSSQLMSFLTEQSGEDMLLLNSHRTLQKIPTQVKHVDTLQDGSLRRGTSSAEAQDFTWVESDMKSDILNEQVICTSLSSSIKACELSVDLLVRLRELLKTYCTSKAVPENAKVQSTFGHLMVKIIPGMFDELLASSSLKAFILQCSKLQRVDLSDLDTNQRLLFFCNVYNIIITHSIITKGTPGNGLLDRSSFMRSSKYNIGGNCFSLLDIEHGILRHASTKPMILGPLTVSISFSDRDPRRALALDTAKPNVSFCLFTASNSSPALTVLRDPASVDDELKKCARAYVARLMQVHAANKVIELPGLFKIYWADFGGNRMKVLKFVSKIAQGYPVYDDLKPILSSPEQCKVVKIDFTSIDWTPYLVL